MTILVTGATGFIGSSLCRRLLRDGVAVRALVRDRAKLDKIGLGGVAAVEGSITDPDAVSRAVEGAKLVFHVAGTFRDAGLSDDDYRAINVGGVRNLIDASRRQGVERLIHTSTCGIHGTAHGSPLSESDPIRPEGIYEQTKAEGDELALAEAKVSGSPEIVVLRPTPVYGPGDTRLLKLFKIAGQTNPVILGDGTPRYHLVYIDDLVDSFILAAKSPDMRGQAFLIGGPEMPKLEELIRTIGNVLGRTQRRIVKLPAAPVRMLAHACELTFPRLGATPPIYRRRVDFFTNDRAFDISKARRLMGYRPKIGSLDGLRRTASWYQQEALL